MLVEDHQIRLLNQNAGQILNVVKATFGSTSFDDRWNSTDCAQHLLNAVDLECQWSFVKKSLGSEAISAKIKLDTLLKVYFNEISSRSTFTESVVSPQCSDYHE